MTTKGKCKVTAEELERALCSLENWLKGIRKVIAQMPKDWEIVVSDHLPDFECDGPGGVPTIKGCPPPDIYDSDGTGIPTIKGCPPPDWYQEPCR